MRKLVHNLVLYSLRDHWCFTSASLKNKTKTKKQPTKPWESWMTNVGQSFAQRNVEHVPQVRQCLNCLPRLFPAAKLAQIKPQIPAKAFELQRRPCLEYPSSTLYRPVMHLKEHTSPSGHFVLEFSSGIPAFPTGEAWFVGPTTTFNRWPWTKKQSSSWAYSPFSESEMTAVTWAQVVQKILFSFALITWVTLAMKACTF